MNGKLARWGVSQLMAIMLLLSSAGAFAAGESLLHNSNTVGTKYGTWGVVGGKYGEFTCATCHIASTTNIKRVVTSIPASIGPNVVKPVVLNNLSFEPMSSLGNDYAGRTTSTRICEVCHTMTNFHQYNVTNAPQSGNVTHANTDCTACHFHATGFKGSCVSCHGHNATSMKPISTGRHAGHMNNAAVLGTNYSCAACHAPTVSDDMVFSNIANHNNGTKNYGGTNAGVYDSVAGTCTNTCHTSGKGLAAATAVNWKTGQSIGCKDCHGGVSSIAGEPTYASSGAGTPNSNSHGKHVAAAADCVKCHVDTTSNGTSIIGSHTNQVIDVKNGGGKTFTYTNDATKTCSNISCHSGDGIVASVANAQWGATMPADCTGCHGNEVNAATKLSGAHNAHMNNAAAGGNFKCLACHAATINNVDNRTITTSANHANSLVNFSGAKAGNKKNCSNIYCHSNGKGAFAAIPAWTSGTNLDCSGCHGNTTATLTTGSHTAHLVKGSTCANCHNNTTSSNTTITGSTHIDGTVSIQQGGSFNLTAVTFVNAGNGTCNNIACHAPAGYVVSNTAQWGVKATCETCHPSLGLSGAHQVHMGALPMSSNAILYNMTANRTPTNSDATYKYGFGCASCHPTAEANHINGTIDVDLNRVGVAGVGSLRMMNHSSASYDKSGTKKCSNIYCHSNASRMESESNERSNTSLAWTDKFSNYPNTDRCAYCHGNQPTTGAHTAHSVGIHTFNEEPKSGQPKMIDGNIFNGKNGKVPIVNKPNTAHGNPDNSTTIGCYICHNEVVKTARNDKNTKCIVCHFAGNTRGALYGNNASIANLSLHVNGMTNVNLAPIKMKSKAQVRPRVRDDKDPLRLNAFDFYSGVWTCTSYKNNSTLSYDVAKVQFDTNTMWHPGEPMSSNCTNIVCHNGRKVSWNLANYNDPNKCMDCHYKL